jgi:NADPH2:quinone reductase
MAIKVVAPAYGGPEVLSVVEADVPAPKAGQVVVDVRAAGINPVDYKIISGAMGDDPGRLPLPVGLEIAGVVVAVGPDAEGPGGPVSVGDEVIAFPVRGGYADTVVAAAATTVPKPAALPWPQAAGTLLTGGTAAHTLQAVGVTAGETLLVHGGAGSVGQLVVQLAAQAGVLVVATAGQRSHDQLRGFGAIPVTYGPGLLDRVHAVAPDGVDAAIDTVGTDEAIDTSLELVADRSRIVSIAAFGRADAGIVLLDKDDPETRVRAEAWRTLLPAVADGTVTVTVARTYPLADAAEALQFVRDGHANGKVVLLP